MTTPQPKSSTLFTERNLLILILATVAGALMGWLTWLTTATLPSGLTVGISTFAIVLAFLDRALKTESSG